MKIKEIFNKMNVILESGVRDLKVFYNIDISIYGGEDGEIKAKGNGSVFIPKENIQSLVSMEDLISYIVNEEVEEKISSKGNIEDSKEMVSEVLILLLNNRNDELIQRNDSINFSLDYGTEVGNSIGVFLTKQKNSPAFSRIMRLNGKAMPSKFNMNAINKQVLYYSTTVV